MYSTNPTTLTHAFGDSNITTNTSEAKVIETNQQAQVTMQTTQAASTNQDIKRESITDWRNELTEIKHYIDTQPNVDIYFCGGSSFSTSGFDPILALKVKEQENAMLKKHISELGKELKSIQYQFNQLGNTLLAERVRYQHLLETCGNQSACIASQQALLLQLQSQSSSHLRFYQSNISSLS